MPIEADKSAVGTVNHLLQLIAERVAKREKREDNLFQKNL